MSNQAHPANDKDLSCALSVHVSGTLVREILQKRGYRHFRWGEYSVGGCEQSPSTLTHTVLCDDPHGHTTAANRAINDIWEERVATLLRSEEPSTPGK